MKYIKTVRLTSDVPNMNSDGRSSDWYKAKLFEKGRVFHVFYDKHEPMDAMSFRVVPTYGSFPGMHNLDFRVFVDHCENIKPSLEHYAYIATVIDGDNAVYLLRKLLESGAITPELLLTVASARDISRRAIECEDWHSRDREPTCENCQRIMMHKKPLSMTSL